MNIINHPQWGTHGGVLYAYTIIKHPVYSIIKLPTYEMIKHPIYKVENTQFIIHIYTLTHTTLKYLKYVNIYLIYNIIIHPIVQLANCKIITLIIILDCM